MGETEYSEALKLGKKEYRARIAKGQFQKEITIWVKQNIQKH